MTNALEKRVSALEDAQQPNFSAPCFWCACEDAPDGESCTHRGWKRINHEDALAELT